MHYLHKLFFVVTSGFLLLGAPDSRAAESAKCDNVFSDVDLLKEEAGNVNDNNLKIV